MSNRKAYADKVARLVPTYMGRNTSTLSNTQLKKIGLTRGIAR